MADVNLTAQFPTRQNGLNVETTAPLITLLNSIAGVQIVDNAALNDNLRQTAVGVTSSFQPLPCVSSQPSSSPSGGQPGSGSNPDPGNPDGPQNEGGAFLANASPGLGASTLISAHSHGAESLTIVRDKLRVLGSTLDELAALLETREVAPPVMVRDNSKKESNCYRYKSTEHGPTGLFRSIEFLQVKASGRLRFLGGLQQAQADVVYIMYLEYGVNTFLNGKPAWVIDPATKQPVFNNKVVLAAQQGCTGGQPSGNIPSCGSDTVVDTMRVVVNFKKIFIGSVDTSVGTPTFEGDFQAAVTSLTEQSFTGVVPFTHSIAPPQS